MDLITHVRCVALMRISFDSNLPLQVSRHKYDEVCNNDEIVKILLNEYYSEALMFMYFTHDFPLGSSHRKKS